MQRFGKLSLTIVAFLVAGPLFAALVVRILGLPEATAWRYLFMQPSSVYRVDHICLYGIVS